MEIRTFAESILFADDLASKLAAPNGSLTDADPGQAVGRVETPGRPDGLALRSGDRAPLPGPSALGRPGMPARVLHALANHELLALELFALALLRFPDAPPGLRKAWVATLRDEQRHFTAYAGRLQELGGSLGDEPVSAFFWDALSTVDDPLQFVAGMEVGLEQANLDHARTWAAAFRAVGDERTAEVLDEVHADEVRHVRVGVRWLRRLKDPGKSDWDAWTEALRFPLTAARARGAEMDLQARRDAGLDDAFTDRLAVTVASRGRTPRLLLVDPHLEDRLAGRSVPAGTAADLALLPGLGAGDGDLVAARRPEPAFLLRLRDAGLVVPGFESPGDVPVERVPWGPSPTLPGWHEDLRRLFDKTWAAKRLRGVVAAPGPWEERDAGHVCRTLQEVHAALGSGPMLVKAGLSASGRHRIRPVGAPTEAESRWLAKALASGPVVVEPSLDVVFEVSAHVDATDEGARWVGLTRFGAAGGSFRGAWIGRWSSGLAPELARWSHEVGVEERMREVALDVGRDASRLGLRGPLGVDALVVGGPTGWRLKPISEVNPRWTFGRLALQLRRRVRGAWLFLPLRVLELAGLRGAAALETHWPEAVPTNDPTTAVRLQTLLVPARTADAARRAIEAAAVAAPGDAEALLSATAWITAPSPPRPPRSADRPCS